MNDRRLLIAAEFHFVHPVKKRQKKNKKTNQNKQKKKQVGTKLCLLQLSK